MRFIFPPGLRATAALFSKSVKIYSRKETAQGRIIMSFLVWRTVLCCREHQGLQKACSELISELMWPQGSDSAQLQRKVLCDQMIVVKHDDNVDFKLYKDRKKSSHKDNRSTSHWAWTSEIRSSRGLHLYKVIFGQIIFLHKCCNLR